MRRDAAGVLLLLVGGALVKIVVDGSYLRYVKPSAAAPVFLAGVVMVGLAVVAWDLGGHRHSGFGVWLLVLPVLAIFLVAPPALGADSVIRAGARSVARPASFASLPNVGVVSISLSEFVARDVWDAGSLHGRRVALTGFVVHEGAADYVARLVITCCAADATPMKVELTGGSTSSLPDDQWVRVVGVVRDGSASAVDGYTPTLVVSSLTTVAAPDDPYEY